MTVHTGPWDSTGKQGFSLVGLNLRAERVNLRAEVKWPQATSSPEGRAR